MPFQRVPVFLDSLALGHVTASPKYLDMTRYEVLNSSLVISINYCCQHSITSHNALLRLKKELKKQSECGGLNKADFHSETCRTISDDGK